jgi:Zn-dependent peptidase ImmA (M78 family)/transcriptional regulator with XRE-family HTH domain
MASTADRVRELIAQSGFSQHEFAGQIGLDDSKLSKSLSGTRRFSSLDLARIAELCKVTVDWLITGEEPPLAVAARTTGGSAAAAIAVARRLTAQREDLTALGVAQPWRPVAAPLGRGLRTEQADRLAIAALERVAEAGRLVTEPRLAELVEDIFGADVAIVDLGAGFDGLAASSDAAKLIVLATSQIPGRQRFTLGHELGHLLAGDDHGVHLDKDIFDRAQQKDPSEMRANAFAAAFLMPEAILRERVGRSGLTEAGFAELACDLLVSPATLAYRLLSLRLIDSGTCDRFKSISGAGAASLAGRTSEWAQRVVEASSPRPPGPLVRDAYMAYESGATTLRPYANLLGVDPDALREALEAESGMRPAS